MKRITLIIGVVLLFTVAQEVRSQPKDVRDTVSDVVQVLRHEWKIEGYFECKKAPDLQTCRDWVAAFDTIIDAQSKANQKAENDQLQKEMGYDRAPIQTSVRWGRQAREADNAAQKAIDAVARARKLLKVESEEARKQIETLLSDIEFTFRK